MGRWEEDFEGLDVCFLSPSGSSPAVSVGSGS